MGGWVIFLGEISPKIVIKLIAHSYHSFLSLGIMLQLYNIMTNCNEKYHAKLKSKGEKMSYQYKYVQFHQHANITHDLVTVSP